MSSHTKTAAELDEISKKALANYKIDEKDLIDAYFDKISAYAEYAASKGERGYTYYLDEDELENAALLGKALLQRFKEQGYRGDILNTILVLFWK